MAEKKKDTEERPQDIEQELKRLDEILDRMEAPDIDLSDSFKLFEEGMGLLRSVNTQIDAVEKSVLALTEDGTLEEFEE